ncbi:hypothetical protein LBYZC6_54900 [Lacrimispora brassicae]
MRLETKADYQKLFIEMLNPLREKFSTTGAGIRLSGAGAGYSRKVIEMEAFARPLWGLVPFWAGGGRDEMFEEAYRKGIAAGTDPDNLEYWGDCEDCDQRFVEMAPMAFGLLLAPKVLWEPLGEREKGNLCAWLYQINNHELPKCNWYYFRILVNLALKAVGRPYSESRLRQDLDYMEECYLGNGWYVDGVSDQKDYYSAFAMQFYSLLYGVFGEEDDLTRCRRLKQRALEFAGDYIYWFDEDGAALPYGRSLLYRFAQAAFWPALLFSGIQAFDPGVIKGVINRNIRYWLAQDIFAGDGTLSVGYAYPNLTMAERYNAPGSPYWCMKTFLLLALPDAHPYWEAQEEALPKLDHLHGIPRADMLLQHRGKEVTAYVPAVYGKNLLGHFKEKYGKFAYSTLFAFSVAHSGDLLSEAAPDSMLAFVPEGEERVWVRHRSICCQVEEDRVVSQWSPMSGVTVVTEIIPVEQGHMRIHRIKSERPCTVYDCGFAVCLPEGGLTVETGKGFIEVKNSMHGCRLVSLEGEMEPFLVEAAPNTNLLYRNTRIPALFKKIEPGETMVKTGVETFWEM